MSDDGESEDLVSEELMSEDRRTSQAFLRVAEGIAQRLCDDARPEDGDGANWLIPDLQDSHGDRVAMGPYLYRGTAGIALFLLRLHGRSIAAGTSPNAEFLETAQRALCSAVRWEDDQEWAYGGYYNGTGGLIATLVEMSEVDSDPGWLEAARRLGDKLAKGLKFSGGLDLIAGEAGSLLGLLSLYQATGDPSSLEAARRLGDELLAICRQEPDGISWDTMHPQVTRNLLGLSHGAGGIGLALLELYRYVDDPRYLVAAVQALRYEDSFAGAAKGLWPDFRHDSLMGYLEVGDTNRLRRDLKDGTFVTEKQQAAKMAAWCHGAPGIAMVRARFLELTGDPLYSTSLRRAGERTMEVVESNTPESHSLCHGRCGNADILLDIGRRLDEPTWIEAALDVARRGIDEVVATGSPWKSGYRDSPPAPGLLLGDAGVGLFYLRCADPQVSGCMLPVGRHEVTQPVGRHEVTQPVGRHEVTQPVGRHEVTQPVGRHEVTQPVGRHEAVARGIRDGYLSHMPRTRKLMTALDVPHETLAIDSSASLILALEDQVNALRPLSEEMPSEEMPPEEGVEKLREILRLEASAFQLLCARQDFTEVYIAELQRNPDAADDPEAQIHLPSGSRLMRCAFDWQPLIDSDGEHLSPGDLMESIVRRPTTYLLHEVDYKTHLKRLDGLAAAMYEKLENPTSVGSLIQQMLEHFVVQGLFNGDDPAEVETVSERLRQVLRKALDEGMIVLAGA